MQFIESIRAAYRWFENIAEAVDYDPVADLQRRVDRLEREKMSEAVQSESRQDEMAP